MNLFMEIKTSVKLWGLVYKLEDPRNGTPEDEFNSGQIPESLYMTLSFVKTLRWFYLIGHLVFLQFKEQGL